MNKLIYGATFLQLNVAGYTVEQIAIANAEHLNLDPRAVAYVNGVKVASDHIVQSGQLIEWIRERGSKGALSKDDKLWINQKFEDIETRIEQITAKPKDGLPGRKQVMTEVAIFAKRQRDDGLTWKEVFVACRDNFPEDDRVKNLDQIRKAVARLCKQQTSDI